MGQHNGATPYTLMSGLPPRVPKALTYSLPALSGRLVPGDDALHGHLDLLHAARSAHIRAEADSSLRRSFARNATNMPVNDYKVGDVVNISTCGVGVGRGRWQGPAHVTDVSKTRSACNIGTGGSPAPRAKPGRSLPRPSQLPHRHQRAAYPARQPACRSLRLPRRLRRPVLMSRVVSRTALRSRPSRPGRRPR